MEDTDEANDEAHVPVVLVVEDEAHVAAVYRRMLASDYEVRTATTGEEALAGLDESVDVVLLDRMLPGISGDDVLAAIRARGVDCRVAMVTAVEPDVDVVRMGFDAYVSKPPTRAELRGTIERLLEAGEYTRELQEYYAALAKRGALTATRNPEVMESAEYAALESEIEELKTRLSQSEDELADDAAFLSIVRSIEDDAETEERT
jgi:DNA-binding response OmpR family regulator